MTIRDWIPLKKKSFASCSILLRLYTPGLTPPGGSAIPKWGHGFTHLLAFHLLWRVGYTHPPKSPMGYASDACTDSGSLAVFGLLCFAWGRNPCSDGVGYPFLRNHGCIMQVYSGGLTHLDLHHQLAVLSPDGAQALHASELFTRSDGPDANHSVRTYGRLSVGSR